METEKNCARCAASVLLRLAMASLFALAAIGKFQNGLDSVVTSFQGMFKDTLLPAWFVTFYARLIPWIELLIPVWLITGFRLKQGWFFTGLVMVSLSAGVLMTKQYALAANNYFYVLMCCAGLYFSDYDRVYIGRCCKNKSHCAT
ncbi:MAG: DoxX family membrane protein [Candidatus Omnitrophica bacterium]|nr:DoxX family membrane protein [Candidatus Omnitrophota bacterium]